MLFRPLGKVAPDGAAYGRRTCGWAGVQREYINK